MGGVFLCSFLLSEHVRLEEVCNIDIQTPAKFRDCQAFRVGACAIEDHVNLINRDIAALAEFLYGDFLGFNQFGKSELNGLFCIHFNHLGIIIHTSQKEVHLF